MDTNACECSPDSEDSCDNASDIVKPEEGAAYDSRPESGSESQMDFGEMGMRTSASSGLTMKEYEEQLKKLTAENFNLKLRVYFVEERLSKVTGISDKEDLIKKNIQLKVTCESQLKELEKKQELLFEASKAFELLQKEHAEEVEKLMKEKDKEIADLEEKLTSLETAQNEIKAKFPNLANLNDPEVEFKSVEEYEKQINELEANLRDEEDRFKELEIMLKDNQIELESYQLKLHRLEGELEQRVNKVEELVDELEQKEHDLAAAHFRIRKLEDELKSKQREEEIMKERIEEKNKTIESLKASLSMKDDSIEALENRIAKERSASQSLQSKLDSLSYQNARLKEECEILQSRLRRTTEGLSPRGKLRASEDDLYKQKYEEVMKAMGEQELQYSKKMKELEERLYEKDGETEDYQELFEKHKKLEDDHRKACNALKNFIKRSSEEKKEREALTHLLNNHEEVIADLKSQLDLYRSNGTLARVPQNGKLSLAETGDNARKFELTVAYIDKDINREEKDNRSQVVSLEKEVDNSVENFKTKGCSCGLEEKMEKVSELEAEVIVLKHQLEDKSPEGKDTRSREALATELESKKGEIEKLNGELKRRNINLQELINKELWDKNRQIEKLEKRLAEVNEKSQKEISVLKETINVKNDKVKIVESGVTGMSNMKEINVNKMISSDWVLAEGVSEMKVWLKCNSEEKYKNVDDVKEKLEKLSHQESIAMIQHLQIECAKAREEAEKAESVRKEAAEVCSLLSMRLEELAVFLDSLLTNRDLLNGITLKKCQDIKMAMEKSKELSRRLSMSFSKIGDFSFNVRSVDNTFGDGLFNVTENESMGVSYSRDKVISEQSVIINKLREQLKILNQEIRQRDIELSHCQEDRKMSLDDVRFVPSDQGIENQSLSLCQELSDYEVDLGDAKEKEEEGEKEFERTSRKSLIFAEEMKSPAVPSQETSESEAWSEPDRSVSLARMGRLEDVSVNAVHRNSKCEDSSESSEETLNENTKPTGKRSRTSESEIRRLQSRIKSLDDTIESLRLENNFLRIGKSDTNFFCRMQKNEEANLIEKLRKTMDRLDECGLTCRQLEEKLAAALERASTSAMQLSRATETISILEEQINQLKEELKAKNNDLEAKGRRIIDLESKIEEITIESELKIIEAVKEKEAAERKTAEVECRLKDAENISKEVESRVNEIEKKISETKKFKKETVMHFKEAEKQVDTAEKMMEEAEKIKVEAERKSKDFQGFIDLMRKEVEEKLKEAERRVKKSEKEKEDLETQVAKLKKRLMEAEKNKTEVELKVKEGKETIQCMEEKLKELEVAMDQCNEEAQKRIKEIQKKADAKVIELEMKIEEREWTRKTEAEKKIAEAEKISKELEVGLKRQLEDSEKKVKKAKEAAEMAIQKILEESKKQEEELRRRISEVEAKKKEECTELQRQLDEAKLEASELELELTKLTNEKIHLEEELKRTLDKESALVKDNKEIKGKYESSIHELETKLAQLTLNKLHLATRLEEIESTNTDLVTRISAIQRGKETMVVEHELISAVSPSSSPTHHGSLLSTLFPDVDGFHTEINGNRLFGSDQGDHLLGVHPIQEIFAPPRRNMNSSPDLGIESDPGRFSSLEANQQVNGDQITGNPDFSEIKKLESENAELRRRLLRTRQALEETLTQLSAANQRKKQVERAICKQLHKTHHILKQARVNFESQDGEPVE